MQLREERLNMEQINYWQIVDGRVLLLLIITIVAYRWAKRS
jgi:hypothetical protein